MPQRPAAPPLCSPTPPPQRFTCPAGELGAELAAEAFERTAALRPAHQYVPWVVVDGQPLYGDYAHLRRYICAAYAGAKCAPTLATTVCFCSSCAAAGLLYDIGPRL